MPAWCSYVQAAITRWPGKLAGVARVDPEDQASVQQLELLQAAGFKGVRFGPVEQEWWNASTMVCDCVYVIAVQFGTDSRCEWSGEQQSRADAGG
jgi:hypothetical protein